MIGVEIITTTPKSEVGVFPPPQQGSVEVIVGGAGGGGGAIYNFIDSIHEASGVVSLVGDAPTPGADMVYGTDGAGAKGWLPQVVIPPIPPFLSFIDSVVNTGGNVSLVGDTLTPGNNKVYGTDGTGARGWQSMSPGGVTSWNTRTGAVVPVANDYSEAQIAFTDILTNNVSTAQHGYQPKLPGDPTLFLDGNGNYSPLPVAPLTGSYRISGGGVAWTGTGLNFITSACSYVINGVQYSSPQTPLTLAPADPTFDRIDVFAVNSAGAAVVITGTPGGPPVEPQVDPATQLKLTSVYIAAGATTPPITNELVYLENTEWNTLQVGGTINLASTNNPYSGSKCVEGTNVATGNYFQAVRPSGTVKLSDYVNVIFQIRSKAAWPNPKAISIFWLNAGPTVGTGATLKQGAYGFDSNNTTGYQQIVIPVAAFNTGTNPVNTIRFTVTGGGGNIGWYIDNIILQSGTGGGGTGGGDFSTNTNVSVDGELVVFSGTTGKLGRRSTGSGLVQLDNGVQGLVTIGTGLAYNGTTHTLSSTGAASTTPKGVTFATSRTSGILTGRLTGYFTFEYAGTISGWSLNIGNTDVGTVTVRFWKIADGPAVPTVANNINISGIQLSTGTHVRSAVVTDFTTTAIAIGDVLAVEITAVTGTVTELSGVLKVTPS